MRALIVAAIGSKRWEINIRSCRHRAPRFCRAAGHTLIMEQGYPHSERC